MAAFAGRLGSRLHDDTFQIQSESSKVGRKIAGRGESCHRYEAASQKNFVNVQIQSRSCSHVQTLGLRGKKRSIFDALSSSHCYLSLKRPSGPKQCGCFYVNERKQSVSRQTVCESSENGRADVEGDVGIAEREGDFAGLEKETVDSGKTIAKDLEIGDMGALQEWLLMKEMTLLENLDSNGGSLQAGPLEEGGGGGKSELEIGKTEEISNSWWGRINNSVTPRVKGLLLLNILTLLYGSNISVVKEAEELLDPASFSTGRFAFAAFVFLPFIPAALKNKITLQAGVEQGIWAALAYLAQAYGVVTTDAGRASFISSFTVIEVPILAGLFGARIPKITWVAALAAIVGVSLLETTGGHPSLEGDFWTIVSAFFFGVHMLRSEHYSKYLSNDSVFPYLGLQLLTTATLYTFWTLFVKFQSGDLASLVSFFNGDSESTLLAVQSVPWVQMFYTGVISTAFCLWIEVVSLRDVSATEAAMVYTLEPLYGAGFAWTLLGERWGLKGWFGAALILGGSLASQVFGQEETKETAAKPCGRTTAALTVLIVATLVAAAAVSRGSSATLESAEQASFLAEGIEIENFATLLRIYAIAKMEEPEEVSGNGGSQSDCKVLEG